MEIPVCPFCHWRVIPRVDGACPNCGRIIASDIDSLTSGTAPAKPARKVGKKAKAAVSKKVTKKKSRH